MGRINGVEINKGHINYKKFFINCTFTVVNGAFVYLNQLQRALVVLGPGAPGR